MKATADHPDQANMIQRNVTLGDTRAPHAVPAQSKQAKCH